MKNNNLRQVLLPLIALSLAACGGGGGGGGGTIEPVDPPDETEDPAYGVLSDRTRGGSGDLTFVVLEGDDTVRSGDVTVVFATGAVSGGLLDGTDLDLAEYLNPANGEYSRIVRISGDNIFGAVGVEVQAGDLPASGTVTSYNEGWVSVTAAFVDDVLVLTGDAEFTATWGSNDIDGRFFNLSGTDEDSNAVNLVGTIVLTNGGIGGDGFDFDGGDISGTGVFSDLGGGGTSSNTQGSFFGPAAEELGGIVYIDDPNDDIFVVGGFQAD